MKQTNLVFTTEKTLKDLEGKVDEAEVTKANEAKDALKAAIEKNDLRRNSYEKGCSSRNRSKLVC